MAIDLHNRECLPLVVDEKFSGDMIAEISNNIGAQRGKPREKIHVENGTEFASTASRSLGLLKRC